MNAALTKLGAIARPNVRRALVGASVVALLAVVAAMRAPSVAATPAPQGIMNLNAPKRAAQNAVAAENAQLSAQTGQAVPTRASSAAPISGPGSNGVAATPVVETAGAIESGAGSQLGAPVTRESYVYEGEGRRDPFFSLILTDDLRPLLADLRLVGILYEPSGRRTVAIMRDLQTNAQYRVSNGATLGRMRVAQIRQRAVIFSIDEFGLSRQDSLVWSDTTKVRN
ncbi:MAG TPA: hypothetical protein VGP25_01150 [Gemmatimonadaceae bacterium]|jgi:hypothetical protein|nr:hypothetical protein [Gemmatimonadaceae bacterium]